MTSYGCTLLPVVLFIKTFYCGQPSVCIIHINAVMAKTKQISLFFFSYFTIFYFCFLYELTFYAQIEYVHKNSVDRNTL